MVFSYTRICKAAEEMWEDGLGRGQVRTKHGDTCMKIP